MIRKPVVPPAIIHTNTVVPAKAGIQNSTGCRIKARPGPDSGSGTTNAKMLMGRSNKENRGKAASSYKYKLTLEYDGTGYSGWQVQKNARSIQGTLIEAARELFGGEVDVQGAGRTDAGVHALAQVAHLDAPHRLPPQKILHGLNDLLPAPINILKVEEAPAGFHARHMARGRSYLYLISRCRTAFGKRYVWWVKDELDLGRMQAAAEIFQGFHDFSSFADKRIDKHLSTEVQIDRTDLETRGELILFRVVGSHFLWKMVRRLAGILVEAGRGTLAPAGIERMLTHDTELPARYTAPPSGLFLAQVLYEGDHLEPLSPPLLHGLHSNRSCG